MVAHSPTWPNTTVQRYAVTSAAGTSPVTGFAGARTTGTTSRASGSAVAAACTAVRRSLVRRCASPQQPATSAPTAIMPPYHSMRVSVASACSTPGGWGGRTSQGAPETVRKPAVASASRDVAPLPGNAGSSR